MEYGYNLQVVEHRLRFTIVGRTTGNNVGGGLGQRLHWECQGEFKTLARVACNSVPASG